MAKHKNRNKRKAAIKKHDRRMLKNEVKERELTRGARDWMRVKGEMSKRIGDICPENNMTLNNDIGEYYSNLDGDMKGIFNELVDQMESGEIYE